MHIHGIMRSANATGLLEMAAARDEYHREVLRLRKLVKEATEDRDRLGMALERNIGTREEEAETRDEDEGEKKSPAKQPSEETSEQSTEMLKAVIRAQHSRIQDLKTKLATAVSSGGAPPKKAALSPKMQREHLAMKANRVDFKGQKDAARRVEDKRRKEKEMERRRKRELGGEGGGTGRGKVKFDIFGMLE
jgi:hypothetical protein